MKKDHEEKQCLEEEWNNNKSSFKNNSQLQETLYNSYYENFSEDEDGLESIHNKNATYFNLLECLLEEGKEVYDLFRDSVVRERLFDMLAKKLKVNYDVIYTLWLEN